MAPPRFKPARTLALGAALAMLLPAAALAFDPALEQRNFAKTGERMQYVTLTPEFQARLTEQNAEDNVELAQIAAAEAAQGADARNFSGNVCFQRKQECAGDVRFYDWPDAGFGVREPVLFTARNGATIDVQGQGRSDTFGEGVDRQEGVPSQSGQPFFDGTEDALDFLLSKQGSAYVPRPSCGNAAPGGIGTDHSPRHERRVAAGLNAPFNPLGDLIDPQRIGIAGHSLGAGAVSYVGQLDPRVDAIVAWDNLRPPNSHPGCPSGSAPRPDDPALTKPALGISNDYGIFATPRTSDPDPQGANGGFLAYRDAGVDSMQFNIRGGTHFESSFIPGMTAPPLGLATLRGMDMVAWYTTAWLDRYVKCAGAAACERDAEQRLLTDRWREDPRGGQVDANRDPNLYSFYLRSRFAVRRADGSQAICDDMRPGCAAMGPDGQPPGYDFVADAFTPPAGAGSGAKGRACALAQEGTRAKDTRATLPPSGAGDAIRGRGGADRLRGGDGDDCLYGNSANDRLRGEGDNDRLKGGPGRDRLTGGPGADRLRGGPAPDVLIGGPGADQLDARRGGRDILRCGPGRDHVKADRRDKLGRGC